MALDRQRTHEIVQALLRAKNRKDGGNIFENVAQARAEAGDLATARGIPAHDQLAFNAAPSTLSRPSNPENSYDQPLAVNARGIVQPRPRSGYSWGSPLPPYGKPKIDPRTFPPLIYQGKEKLTEADKEACHKQFDDDEEQCKKNYSYNTDAWYRCKSRATTIRDLCLRGEKEILPWSDVDEDGVRFDKPGKGRKKK